MPETRAKKNLQLKTGDETFLNKFHAARTLLGIDTESDMVKFCIDFTVAYIAKNPEEFIAARKRALQDALAAIDSATEIIKA